MGETEVVFTKLLAISCDSITSGTEPSATGESSYTPPPPPTKAEQEAYGKKQLVDLGGKIKDANIGNEVKADNPGNNATKTFIATISIPVTTVKGGFDAAKAIQETVSDWAQGSRLLGRSSGILTAISVGYDFYTGTANTSTLVNAGVAIIGSAIIVVVGAAAGPWVAAGGVVYGIISLAGGDDWINSHWDLSDEINIVTPNGP